VDGRGVGFLSDFCFCVRSSVLVLVLLSLVRSLHLFCGFVLVC